MIMKKILVPIEFNAASGCVLDCARTLSDALGASLHLLHVVGDPMATPATLHRKQADARARLDALLDQDDRIRRHATVSCEAGTPAYEIAHVADDEAADLIVMGTHSHGPTFRMTTGSIAEAVIAMAPCAVLTVKPPGERVIEACA